MDLALIHEGTFRLHNFRSTNKVKEDEEVLTCYLTMTGMMPAELFATINGLEIAGPYKEFWWDGNDGQSNFPAIGHVPFDTVFMNHLVELGSGIKYVDEDAIVRGFALKPEYGHQWDAKFEILVKPKQKAVIGRFAAAEGHDISVAFKGPRQRDLLQETGE